ncbi:MAG: DUF4430 domain-containing protein [Solibacillus sp.]
MFFGKKLLNVVLAVALVFSMLTPGTISAQAEELETASNDGQAVNELLVTTPDSVEVEIQHPTPLTKEELLNNLNPSIDTAIQAAMDYVVGKIPAPKYNNEWGILLLARGGYNNQDYFNTYLTNVDAHVLTKDGVLSNSYTDYSRLTIGLAAVGKNATAVNGYNLLEKLADYEKVVKQGINGSVYGLLALDTYQYNVPQVELETATTREKLIEAILAKEIDGGGFAFSGTNPDVDMTAMTLQALAPYKAQQEVAAVIDRGLAVLAKAQLDNGGFKSYGSENVQSAAQVLVALSALGIDAAEDARFVKADGAWIVSNMMEFYSGTGFKQPKTGKSDNQMATQQAGYALVAYDRFLKGKTSLYDMTDVTYDRTGTATESSTSDGETSEGEVTVTDHIATMSIKVSDEEIILPTEQFNITADETAYSLLKRITLQKQIALDDRTTDMGAYIAGIAGVKEFDHGPTSGWMYRVNGETLQFSADNYVVQPNDEIEWLYTKNLGEDLASEKTTVTVRVEGYNKTILPKTAVEVAAFDLTGLVTDEKLAEIYKTNATPLALHAIIQAFKDAGYDVTDKEQFNFGDGSYFTNLAGLKAGAVTTRDGWSYAVNNKSPNVGVNAYELKSGEEIVVYFGTDWQVDAYSYFTLQAVENKQYTVQLSAIYFDENWAPVAKPVSDATIIIDGKESAYKTDANGLVTLQFTEAGKHELTAIKKAGDYSIISRPYLAIDVNKEMVVTPEPTPVEPEPTPEPTQPEIVVPPSAVTPLVEKTTAFLLQKAPTATFSSEWAIISLARSQAAVPKSYYDNYLASVADALKEANGTLEGPRTEHSRLILALSAIGVDATNVGGYNVYAPLHDFEQVIAQGLNGPIFALLAFDAQKYNPPVAALGRVASLTDVAATTVTTREKLVDHIVSSELAGGGFALSGTKADPDLTAMALQALAPYKADAKVAKVIDRAVAQLASIQLTNAGYTSAGSENVQSAAQVLIALSTLNIDAEKDARFVKNGQTILGNIESYAIGDGSYKHPKNGAYNAMATQQVTQALVAYDRFKKDLPGLFDMADVTVEETPIPTPTPGTGGASGGGSVTPAPVPTEQVAYIAITNKSYGDILAETEVKLNKGDTVYSVLKRATDAKGITLNTRSSSYGKYVVGIAGVKEFDRGRLSGWMYRANGDFPSYSSDSHTVNAGDSIEWVYTEDLGKDVGGYVNDIENKPAAGGAGGGAAVQKPAQSGTEQPVATTTSNEKLQVAITATQIAALKNAPFVMKDNAGGKVEIPSAILKTLNLKENETLNVAVTNENNQIQVTLEKEAAGKKSPVAAGKNYVKVTLPTVASANTVVLQLVDGELKAVPHKVVNNEIVLFVKASGTFVVSEDKVTFNDIDKLVNKDDIEFLASRLVIKGKDAENFAPNDKVTRAQFAALVSRALGLQANEASNFTDTKGKWYESDVQALLEAGVTTGKTATTFDPGANMTREQGAVFMARILAYTGYEAAPADKVTFKDEASINAAYKENIALLVDLGIMSGKEDGTFDAKGNLTRGQLAKMLKRTLTISGLM